MTRPGSWLRLWFTFDRLVGRREYLLSGLALGALKYAGDLLIVWLGTGRFWHPRDYFSPVSSLASAKFADDSLLLLPVLALWALPFLWIGVSMSMRRALDAGRSAWLALLFFVPGVSYLFMAVMSALPTRPAPLRPMEKPRPHEDKLPRALLAIAAGAVVGFGMIALSVFALGLYGVSLFLGTPFVIGALTAYLFNRQYPASTRETQEVVFMTLAFLGGVALLTAAEGAFCLLMVAPLAWMLGGMGASLGRRVALRDVTAPANALIMVAILPLSMVLERDRPPSALREVKSSVEIDAPPDVVWRSVIAFPPITERPELFFRAGVAYPLRAEIVGEGVGAVRYCVFSTGSFVEPITHWEPGRRLSFDVTEQPRPLQEWSPYANVAPPHLDGYFRSRRGEFRLIALEGGRTRLEGSTWYEMRLYPEGYWVLFGDAFVGRIHERVLRHIKRSAETGAVRPG
jgi:uncharacterized membrane protein YhaH (DUF805 family)